MAEDGKFSDELLDLIACPVCKSRLFLDDIKNGLVCRKCRHTYKIVEGIPILLPPEMG